MNNVLFETLNLQWIIFLCILFYLIYYYSTATYNYWKDKGIPFLEPFPLFGNTIKTISLIQPLEEGLKELYFRLSPHSIGGYYDLRKPMLLARDPELLKHILVKDYNYFQDRGYEFNDELEPLSANLLTVGGKRWKNLRNKLSPAFTSAKLKQMFGLIVEVTDNLKLCLNNKIKEEGPIQECRGLIAKFSADIVGSCFFGINCNTMLNENSEFLEMGNKFFSPSYEYTIRRIIRFFFPKIADIFKIKDIPPEVTKFFLELTKKTLEYREKHNIIRNDLMELLKQLKNKGSIVQESDELDEELENRSISTVNQPKNEKQEVDVVFNNNILSAQAFSFFIAGFETTGAALTFSLHELAVNPEIQEKLRAEILSMLEESNGKLIYENINKLSYLEKVISETLRKYPTAGHTLRKVTKSYIIPGTNICLDVGDTIVVSIYGLQNDPKYYPNPERFDPERFSKEEILKRHPYSYIPFGTGPRICIGMKFALLQLKTALVVLLSNFKFEVCNKTQHPLQLDSKTLIMSIKNGAWLKVIKLDEKYY